MGKARRKVVQEDRINVRKELVVLSHDLAKLSRKVLAILELSRLNMGVDGELKHEIESVFSLLKTSTKIGEISPKGLRAAFAKHQESYGRGPIDIIMSPKHFFDLRALSSRDAKRAKVRFESGEEFCLRTGLDPKKFPDMCKMTFASIRGIEVKVREGHPLAELL